MVAKGLDFEDVTLVGAEALCEQQLKALGVSVLVTQAVDLSLIHIFLEKR